MKSKSILSFVSALAFAASSGADSTSWAGSNSYYLHGLQADEQAAYISALQSYGAKVVRLWVSTTGDGCQKSSTTVAVPEYESDIGSYNNGTLDALDSVLSQLHAVGIKAIISPHDANLLPPSGQPSGYNGIDIYGTTYGSSDVFYGSATAKSQYDARLKSILEYTSPAFGKQWKDLSEVILAFDIQNEPMIASPDKLGNNDPDDWLCGRAGNMKTVLGSSAIKVATGGVGGSQYDGHEYNLISKALYCSAIDILSVHGYMSQASQWTQFVPSLADDAAAQDKLLMIEEWGVGTDPSADSVADQVAVFNGNGVPWLYWMIIPGKSVDESCDGQGSCCHEGLSTKETEDYEVGVTSSRADFEVLIGDANAAAGRQDWTGSVF